MVRLGEGECEADELEELAGEGSAFVEHITLFCRFKVEEDDDVEDEEEGECAAEPWAKWAGNCGVMVTCGLGTMETEEGCCPLLAGEMGGDIKGTNELDELVCINVDKSGLERTFCTTARISSFILNFFSKSSKAAEEFKGTVFAAAVLEVF